jgi:CspA family cold shock protein
MRTGYTLAWNNGVPFGNELPGGVHEVTYYGKEVMAEGTIKKLTDKGFGFIKTSTEKDLFFHSKALQGVEFDDLQEGQKVSYTEGRGPKGPCAENVKLV